MRTILATLALALAGLSGCTPTFPLEDGREASTLTGEPLMRIEPDASKMSKLEQDLATAKGWRIRELHRQLPTLEDVFVELAAADSGARPFG